MKILVIFFILVVCCNCEKHEFYAVATSNSSEPCPVDTHCERLATYLQDTAKISAPQTTLILLSGVHDLGLGKIVSISNVIDFSLSGSPGTTIHCSNATGLAFLNVTNLKISHVQIELCGAPIGQDLHDQVMDVYSNTK